MKYLDSTLRDGAQAENLSYSLQDKLNITQALDAFGMDFIEGGNPFSNPKDMEFFHSAASIPLKNSRLLAFGSTRRRDAFVEQDEGIRSLIEAGTQAVSIVGKSSMRHAREILLVTPQQNFAMIGDTVRYLKSKGKFVVFDAEHFFDGYVEEPEMALKSIQVAFEAGADVVCLCDTNGDCNPFDLYEICRSISGIFEPSRLGVHCHNDMGCAVANSIAAARAGFGLLQGTFLGVGERCGNAALATLMPDLELKKNATANNYAFSRLTDTAVRIAEISNVAIPRDMPYVGVSAFAHKGGMHVDGMLKMRGAFEHVSPESVGNHRRFLMSEMSGRSTLLEKIRHINPDLTRDSPKLQMILDKVKALEYGGYQYEGAEASLELLARKSLEVYKPHFELVQYKTIGEYSLGNLGGKATAMIEVKVGESVEISAAIGNGPVNALDLALRRALKVFYPRLDGVHLIDYKVRVLDSKSATAAFVRVLIESTDGTRTWSTVGLSTDIIEASWLALADSIEYYLL